MPQHKSAKKRLRQTVRKTAINKSVKSNVATQLKAIDKLIKDKKVDETTEGITNNNTKGFVMPPVKNISAVN